MGRKIVWKYTDIGVLTGRLGLIRATLIPRTKNIKVTKHNGKQVSMKEMTRIIPRETIKHFICLIVSNNSRQASC